MRGFRVGAMAVLVSGAMTVAGLMPATATSESSSAASRSTLHVGSLTLTRCNDVIQGAWCGSLPQLWDPDDSGSGTLDVGFAFVPASDTSQPALGTLVPHEGGPGYSTTGSAVDYAGMYGPLLKRHNMLLVDQRGTGMTALIKCPSLQKLDTGAYAPAAATCAAKLGAHADLFGSELSADDLSAVISALALGKVDLYGDSYGTFFAQVFLGRHWDQLRSVVVDSAYPTHGETAWYPTQGPAMTSSFAKVCRRTPACNARPGSTMHVLDKLLTKVRAKPLHGRAVGADGVRHKVTIDAPLLVSVAFNATYGPVTYREFDPAIRSALHGDTRPLSRLVAEENFVGGTGPAVAYSEGADAAVSCQDYPQLYDMADSPSQRQSEFDDAVAAEQSSNPDLFAPFTIQEYLHSDWEEQDWCLQWPETNANHPAHVPQPIGGTYHAVPTLVLSGELDSITTPAEGALVASQIPGAKQVKVANSFHVTAEDDTDGCGRAIVQDFVRHPALDLPADDLKCADSVAPVRGSPSYVSSFRALPGPTDKASAAHAAAATAADVMDRWWQSYAGAGDGLRGGTWTSRGDRTVTLTLHRVRLTRNLAVSGTVRWGRYAHSATVSLTLLRVHAKSGKAIPHAGVSGVLTGHWDTRKAGAKVHLTGLLGGHHVTYRFRAP